MSVATRDATPLVPWRDIIGMRHRLAHGYAETLDSVVRDTVTLDIPALLHEVGRALEA